LEECGAHSEDSTGFLAKNKISRKASDKIFDCWGKGKFNTIVVK